MKNKQLYFLSFISTSLLLQPAVNAAPLVSIGDSTDIYFNGSTSLRSSSNIFRQEANEVDDLIWTLSPGFQINVGRGASNADLSIITRYDIVRYNDNNRLDTELFHIQAIGSYKTSRLDVTASASFDEQKSSAGDNTLPAGLQDLIESDNTAASVDGEYRYSPKFSFGAGVRYSEKEYTTFNDIFADRETLTVPLDVFYELTPKVDLSVGYSYTSADVEGTLRSTPFFDADPTAGVIFANGVSSGDYDSQSHFFNIGARGNLLPKLSGFFKIGYRTRSVDDSVTSAAFNGTLVGPTGTTNRDDSGMLGLDANFTWAATPKVTVDLGLSRDFGVGGEGQSTENTSVDLSGNYSINSYWAASANYGYTLRDYTDTGREDDQYDAGLRLLYSPSQYWRFSAGYTYTENSASDASRSYEDHIFDLTATLRY